MTSWKTKGRYVAEPLNFVNHRYEQAGPSGTKDILSDISSEHNEKPPRKRETKANIHKLAEELLLRNVN